MSNDGIKYDELEVEVEILGFGASLHAEVDQGCGRTPLCRPSHGGSYSYRESRGCCGHGRKGCIGERQRGVARTTLCRVDSLEGAASGLAALTLLAELSRAPGLTTALMQ
jgi:hypothetical protein